MPHVLLTSFISVQCMAITMDFEIFKGSVMIASFPSSCSSFAYLFPFILTDSRCLFGLLPPPISSLTPIT